MSKRFLCGWNIWLLCFFMKGGIFIAHMDYHPDTLAWPVDSCVSLLRKFAVR